MKHGIPFSLAAAYLALFAVSSLNAQQLPPPTLSGGTPHIAPPPGIGVFNQNCAACHTEQGMNMGGRQIPNIATLRSLPPERIYDSLVTGKMQDQGASLSDPQKRAVATWLSGRQLVDVAGTDVNAMQQGVCASPTPLTPDKARWSGWGNSANNSRFQAEDAAGLSAGMVPDLKLKWAFGVPGAANMYSQPAVAWGRVFFGSDNAALYSIDAETGCAYWSFHAEASIRSAPTAVDLGTASTPRPAVLFTTVTGTAYAVEAGSGTLIWKTEAPARNMRATGSGTYFDGRYYLPFTATETVQGARDEYPCCTSRGNVVALNARTGALVWRTETIAEPLLRIGANQIGTSLWGPSGASVWNAPTIDPERGVLYVGTGNSFGPVAARTSDSILALRLDTGALVWHHQEFENDSFMLGCPRESVAGGNCPTTLGPDWDFGGSSAILRTLSDGRDVLVAAGKGGIAIALDPDRDGELIWRTPLFEGEPPTADGLVLFGGAADDRNVYYPLQRAGGGLTALDLATGRKIWTAALDTDPRGQIGPATAIPGVIFSGGWDGIIRAINDDGALVWSFDTKRSYQTINGIEAHGGSLGQAGATIADGRLFVTSGYIGMQQGTAGNVILAFEP